MPILKEIRDLDIQFGGEAHQGWLPKGSAEPLPTPTAIVKLNFQICEEDGGYLFIWEGPEPRYCGDSWHPSLSEALEQAQLWFGIRIERWVSV